MEKETGVPEPDKTSVAKKWNEKKAKYFQARLIFAQKYFASLL